MIPYPRSLLTALALLFTGLALAFNAGPAFAQDVQIGPFTLPAGKAVTIEFEALITDPFPADASSVSNQGTVTFDGSGPVLTDDPDTPAAGDPTVTPVIQEIDADLSIAKSGPTQVVTGETFTYTLMVSNSGPDAAPNVVVEDTLPSGVTFLNASPECDGISVPGTVTCTLASVAVSPPTVNLTIDVTAPNTPGVLTNSVTVDSDDADDPNPGNNSAMFDTTVEEPTTTTTTTTLPPTTTTTTLPPTTTTTTLPPTTTTTTLPPTTTTTTTIPPPLACGGRTPTIVGTNGNNTITGTSGNDVIVGLGGNDIINGGNGDDIICGGEGNDVLNGNNGQDRLFGENGNDALNGDNGNDALDGGAQSDTCNGGNGSDTAASCESLTSVP